MWTSVATWIPIVIGAVLVIVIYGSALLAKFDNENIKTGEDHHG